MSGTHDIDFYLVASKKNSYALALPRVTLRKPSLGPGEVAIQVKLNLPSILFERPQLQASITVSDEQVSKPVIDANVINNIESMLAQQLGIDLTISVADSAIGEQP